MAELSAADARSHAQRMMQEGRSTDAEQMLRGIVARNAKDAESFHLLGIIYAQSQRYTEAETNLRTAISLSPRSAAYHANLGNVLQEMGRVDDAIGAYSTALKLDSSLAIVRGNLANALQRLGRFVKAIEHYQAALRAMPGQVVFHVNLGNALRASGRPGEAAESYQRAVNIEPRYLDALLGVAISRLDNQQFQAAADACNRALALDPNSQPARQMLGTALRSLARPVEAIVPLRELIVREPARWEAWHELAGALREAGNLPASVDAYRRTIALNPNYAGAHYGLAWSLLQQRDYAAGLPEYEWRERLDGAPRAPMLPRWDGTPGKHQRVVLIAEQGLGDSLMAYRYLSMVRERVGEVILQCPPALRTLFAEQPGGPRVVTDIADANATVYCPMMSLPLLLETRVETIPATTPYLFANAARRESWRARMRGDTLNIGLAWVGNKTPLHRSISPEELRVLATLAGVRFHSLQGGATAREINAACTSLPIVDWSSELVDFAEVAALVANLDGVVTIDTAVAHLAGAMGKPTFVLLNYAPDWRWLIARADSVWYPSVKLFRQKTPLDWQPPLRDVIAALRK